MSDPQQQQQQQQKPGGTAPLELEFTTLDVFTGTRMEGNPLAVVSVPAALRGRLTQGAKQRVAREFNLSETVFLHEPPPPPSGEEGGDESSSSSSSSRDIDIFVPDREIRFAGHPTIGTAVLLRHYDRARGGGGGNRVVVDRLVCGAGPIELRDGGDGDSQQQEQSQQQQQRVVSARVPHEVHLHSRTLRDVTPAGAKSSSSSRSGEEEELDAPVVSIVRGMAFALIRLPSLEALAGIAPGAGGAGGVGPDPDSGGALLDEGWREGLALRYYYVDEGRTGGPAGSRRRLRARLVMQSAEDPATGSAASALAAYLTLYEGGGGGGGGNGGGGERFEITQGVEMGRRSVISVETTTTTDAEGKTVLRDLYLGGTAVVVMRGSLTVDV